MRSSLVLILLSGALLTGSVAALADTPATDTAWQQQVTAISAGDDSDARAAAITAQLDAHGITWRSEAFAIDGQQGRNVVADLGGDKHAPLLLIGAHYDRVAVGRGATDNASGAATALALAAALHAKPLANHRVQVVFWDLEEKGLLGSRAWVATPGREQPALYINFDVFGWGDTLWMMHTQADDALAALLSPRAREADLGFSAGALYPPSDHLAFLKAGWPAVSFSLMGGDEIAPTLAAFGGTPPETLPKVMQVIHSPRDTTEQLDATQVPRALQVLEAGLRAWDARPATTP